MKKVIIFISLGLSLMILVTWYFASQKEYQKNTGEEKIYTIKESYRFLKSQEAYTVKCYINHEDNLFDYLDKAESHLMDIKEDTVIRINLKGEKTGQKVIYNKEAFEVYNLSFNLDMEELKIDKAKIKITFENKEYTLYLGSIEILNKSGMAPFMNYQKLAGLSFKEPYLSLGGIIIELKNKEASTLKITRIELDNSHNVGNIEGTYTNETDINKVLNYNYKDNQEFREISLKPGEVKTYLLPLNYQVEERLLTSYLIFETNFGTYYLDNFSYLKTNDLASAENLLALGEKSEI